MLLRLIFRRYPNVEKIAERRLNQSGGDISLMPKPVFSYDVYIISVAYVLNM